MESLDLLHVWFVSIDPYLFVALTLSTGLLWKVRQFIQGYWFDRRCSTKKDCRGRVFLVTGCTSGGLGCAAAELFAEAGAKVVISCRTEEKAEEARARVRKAVPGARVEFVLIDFLSEASIRDGASDFLRRFDRLDVLVLNAGIGSGRPAEMWMANYIGPFLLTELLTPILKKTALERGDVRVVCVSSGAHKRASICFDDPFAPPPDLMGAYGQSKLAQIMHVRELQRRVRASVPALAEDSSFRGVAVTPGFAVTRIFELRGVYKAAWPLLWLLGRSPRMGAQAIKMAALDDEVPGGSYISNCYVKPSEGKDGCSNDPAIWKKMWELSEACLDMRRFP